MRVAIIKPEKLQDVRDTLMEEEIYGMTIYNVLGAGTQPGYTETYRGVMKEVNLIKHVKLEIAVNQDLVERAIDAIIKGARTGDVGDGKNFVLDLPQSVRIRTMERGTKAI